VKKERQLPLSFNNDHDVKRVRDSLRTVTGNNLRLLSTAVDFELTSRGKEFRKTETKDALAGFLDKISFDYFCTFTTRKPVSMFATRRIADQVCERVDAGIKSSVFWAAEEFDVRDGFHFHALMKFDSASNILVANGTTTRYEPFNKMDLFDWYYRKYGRCQIIDNREPDRQFAASHYVAKYVTKKITDYDFRISRYHMK